MARRHMIDEMDFKIMKRLQLDARISNVRLAEDVHLSPSACLERVKALEKAGLIRRYVADFDLTKICSSVMLLVEVILENHREADFERFLAAIRKRNEVLECYKIGGRIDYLMRVLCRDIDHYNELSDFMSRGELGVEKFHGHVVLAIDKAFQGYPLDLLIEPRGRDWIAKAHAIFHVIVENQAALGDEIPVRGTLERLMGEGLDRHAAIHAIASVLSGHVFDIARGKPGRPDANAAYFAALGKQTVESWRRDYR